jgi:hypothetical protein
MFEGTDSDTMSVRICLCKIPTAITSYCDHMMNVNRPYYYSLCYFELLTCLSEVLL